LGEVQLLLFIQMFLISYHIADYRNKG